MKKQRNHTEIGQLRICKREEKKRYYENKQDKLQANIRVNAVQSLKT